jgi:3-deoxy-D-manno-octulosonic-acid transferase
MANSDSHSTLSYRLLTWGLFPGALIYTCLIALKFRSISYFKQRLGLYKKLQNTRPFVWCHCASVGEIKTALPLLKTIIDHGEHLLVTTNTVTGKQILNDAQLKNTQHVFLPLDYCSFAQRLINTFTPKICLIFETELWPNILLTLSSQKITSTIINGRISERTLHAPTLILKNYRKVLNGTQKILASSKENASRFAALGANANKITTLDNLKFAGINTSTSTVEKCRIDYPFLLCASTHQGEEQAIIEQWKISKPENLGLVIAIRHPQRSKEVCAVLEKNALPYCLHSNNLNNATKDKIYIIDTLGQLMPFMSQAEFVFMGGSLVPVGGHNLVEPAQFSRCILIGPHYDDFKEIVNDLIAHDGILVVKDAQQLMSDITRLTNNNKTKLQLGRNAKSYLNNKQDVLKSYQDIVFELLEKQA